MLSVRSCWHRLLYVDAELSQRVNPLIYPFLFATTLYGLGFLFLGDWSGVSTSSLFTATIALHKFLPALWGLFASLAGILGFVTLLVRQPFLGEAPSFLGFSVWAFAAFVYILNSYWLVLLTVALPNLYFWVWWFFRVKWYEREKKSGRIVDPR